MTFRHPAPLIVCGYMRSGTTMCARILNNSSLVELHGETPDALAEPTLKWLATVKREYGRAHDEQFYRLCRAVFRDTSQYRPITRRGVRWFGQKMPRHEQRFATFETLFDRPEARPHYVYCLRNPFDVWRSNRVMPWRSQHDVRAFLRAWIESVGAFERMRTAAQGRVFLFNLDEFLAAPDPADYVQGPLLDGLKLDPSTLRQPVRDLENSNSAEAKLGAAPPEVPAGEIGRIARNRHVRRILAAYFPMLEGQMSGLPDERDKSGPGT